MAADLLSAGKAAISNGDGGGDDGDGDGVIKERPESPFVRSQGLTVRYGGAARV